MTNLDFIPRTWELLMKPYGIACKRDERRWEKLKKVEQWGRELRMKKLGETSRENKLLNDFFN